MTGNDIRDPDVIAAALLHDTINKDHAAELAPDGRPDPQAALAELTGRFGPRAAELVADVTNPKYDPYRDTDDKHERYCEHVAASLDASPWARIIKASDFTDNGVSLIRTTEWRLEYLARKYAGLVPVLRDDQPARHPARRGGPAAHPGTARPGQGAIRRHIAASSGLTPPGRCSGERYRTVRGPTIGGVFIAQP